MTKKKSAKANAEILFEAMAEKLGTHDADTISEDLNLTSVEYLEANYGDKFDGWTSDELHAAVAALLRRLGPSDGIEFAGSGKKEGVDTWLAATPVESGRLPSKEREKRRWIRLDTITTVHASPNIATGDDPRNWLFSVTVRSEGKDYHASSKLFRGEIANAAVDKVLSAVARMLRAS